MGAQERDSWCPSRFREGFLEAVMPEVMWPSQDSWEMHSRKSRLEAWNHIVKEGELWVLGFYCNEKLQASNGGEVEEHSRSSVTKGFLCLTWRPASSGSEGKLRGTDYTPELVHLEAGEPAFGIPVSASHWLKSAALVGI